MIVFHADTHKLLQPNMELNLSLDWSAFQGLELLQRRICRIAFDGGVSCFGSRVLAKPDNREQRESQLTELMAEYVRTIQCPDNPSRFKCVFAARSVEAARKWSDIIAGDGEESPVYAIECSTVYIADARKLDFPDTQSYTSADYPASLVPLMSEYWRSVFPYKGDSPASVLPSAPFYEKEEILVPLPARVLYRV